MNISHGNVPWGEENRNVCVSTSWSVVWHSCWKLWEKKKGWDFGNSSMKTLLHYDAVGTVMLHPTAPDCSCISALYDHPRVHVITVILYAHCYGIIHTGFRTSCLILDLDFAMGHYFIVWPNLKMPCRHRKLALVLYAWRRVIRVKVYDCRAKRIFFYVYIQYLFYFVQWNLYYKREKNVINL